MHRSVLLQEAIDGLDLQKGDVYLDATLGLGGHMEEVWRRMGDDVELYGIDADFLAVETTQNRLEALGAKPHLTVINFRNIEKIVELYDFIPNKILFDLGWNSTQIETKEGEEGRGFSFLRDEPLVMTLERNRKERLTAYEVVNLWQEENLADIIYGFGEEKHSRRIAKAIVEARNKKRIETSLELAEIVKNAVPVWYRFGKIHPATKTFQAIRIAVNDELEALKIGLDKAFKILEKNGRIAVISFHSLEDRIVKNFFKDLASKNLAQILTKKPITAGEKELDENRRSRSAKLRIIKKIG